MNQPQQNQESTRYKFLKDCYSKPLTLGELETGDKFIEFPEDGDDHGGFKGGQRLFVKTIPWHPGAGYADTFIYTCREYERPEVRCVFSTNTKVIKIVGI